MKMREIRFVRAINEAIREEMHRDKTVFLMGEDVWEGVFGATRGMLEEFGAERVWNTPLAELGFVGVGVGAAAAGMRPIVDIGMFNFSYLAMDQIVNQAAKMRYMFGGQVKLPIVIRGLAGGGGGTAAQHSDSPHPMFMNVPGLKVVVPSTPYDGKGLLKAAIRDDNPVVFFEFTSLGRFSGAVPEEEYIVPLGVADVKREGSDVTVVAIGPMVPKALAVAEELAKDGISVEVVDPRTLVPMDKKAITSSVQKTGRLVVAEDASRICGAAAEIAALVVEDDDTFGCLDAPIQRVTRPHVPVPYSPPLENFVIPDAAKIKAAVQKVLQ
jgi:pyruvate dehydrogenase E1 component beta subunit